MVENVSDIFNRCTTSPMIGVFGYVRDEFSNGVISGYGRHLRKMIEVYRGDDIITILLPIHF